MSLVKRSSIFLFLVTLFIISCEKRSESVKDFRYYSKNFEYYPEEIQKNIQFLIEERLETQRVTDIEIKDIKFDTIISGDYYFFEDAVYEDSLFSMAISLITTSSKHEFTVIYQKPGYRSYIEKVKIAEEALKNQGYKREYETLNDTVLYKYKTDILSDSVKVHVKKNVHTSFFKVYINNDSLTLGDTLNMTFEGIGKGGVFMRSYRILVNDSVRIDNEDVYIEGDRPYIYTEVPRKIGIHTIKAAEKAHYISQGKEYFHNRPFEYRYIVLPPPVPRVPKK